ncbi:hypothetical protein BC628DRAFT_1385090 [Trametes gibbosa]|nr:hypothetical protein BC628DRAFT_1385090 [Trametes gibbosa]
MHNCGGLESVSSRCWSFSRLLLTLFALCTASITAAAAAQDHTNCASGQLDWYTSVVGETPCKTYERLRQICNGDYQVLQFVSQPPGDKCDDQVSACCCNTIAFGLSMLCMNCQQDALAGEQTGIDAPIGTYQNYLGSCGSGLAHSLRPDIQQAVCNKNIKLDDYLYGGWDDGSWFYVWTKENAERDHAANNNNTFTHCQAQVSSSTAASQIADPASALAPSSGDTMQSSTLVPSSFSLSATSQMSATSQIPSSVPGGQNDNSQGGSRLSAGASAAIGGVIGVFVILLAAGIGFLFWRRRRARDAYSCPSNLAHRSHNLFQPRGADSAVIVSPYLAATDTHGQMDGDIKPHHFG